MQGLRLFRNEFNKLNNTAARMLDDLTYFELVLAENVRVLPYA